jgi:proline iminopeptidase
MQAEHAPGRHVATPHGTVWMEEEGEGTCVVLVSGGPGVGHAHYHPWFSALADRHRVVYFDHLGTGRSDRPSGTAAYVMTAYADSVAALLDECGEERAHIVGLSFGGIAASALATRHPDRVRSLVLSNAHVRGADWQRTNIDMVNEQLARHFPHAWQELLELRQQGVLSSDLRYQDLLGQVMGDLEWWDVAHRPSMFAPEDPAYDFALDTYIAVCGPDPEWTLGGTLAGFDGLAEPSELTCPVHIVSGRWDRVTPPVVGHAIAAELRAAGVPVTHHVHEQSAHRPWAEEPDDYFAQILEFLDTTDQGR